MENHKEKQMRYADLKERLKKALKQEFWFEACLIEYAIIEDRTASILYHSKVCLNAFDSNKKLSNKLNSIEHQIGKKHPIIAPKVTKETVEFIRQWKDKRNDLVHRACDLYREDLAKDIALDGALAVKRISNESAKVTRLVKKLQQAEAVAAPASQMNTL